MKARFLWRALRARYRDQAPELAALRRHIRPGDLVCDVGANKGSYLYWMSRWAGRVVAFEPQPDLARYLENARDALGLDNITIERLGVSDTSGEAWLYLPSANSPEASLVAHTDADRLAIRLVKLDDRFAPSDRIGVMKIDVEGAELRVFRGAERILREQRPVLLFESEQRHLPDGRVADGFTYLESLGYSGWFFHRGRLKPTGDFDPDFHQSPRGERFWLRRDYCNNFLFLPTALADARSSDSASPRA